MPSKLLGMLATGKPIIAMAEKNTQLEKELTGVGLVIKPGNASNLAKSIKIIYNSPKKQFEYGELSRSSSLKWDKDKIINRLFNRLKQT